MARSIHRHGEGCGCCVCKQPGQRRLTVAFRVRPELKAWVEARGGSDFLRGVLEKAMEEENAHGDQ